MASIWLPRSGAAYHLKQPAYKRLPALYRSLYSSLKSSAYYYYYVESENIALQHVTRTPLNSTRLLVVTLRHKFWLLLLFCTTRSLVSFPCHGARAERLHVYEYFEVTRLEARNSPWKALSRAPVTTKALPPPATQSTTINGWQSARNGKDIQ